MKQHTLKKLTNSRRNQQNMINPQFFLHFLKNKGINLTKSASRFLIIICMHMLTGCTSDLISSAAKSLGTLKSSPVWLNSVSFKTSDKVNDFSPVLVHIVIPYSHDLYQELIKMHASEYFTKIQQIKLDNSEKMDVFEWELVRSQTINDEPVKPSKFSGEGIIVFANYSTPGAHRINVGEDEKILITLNDNDFVVAKK